MPTRPDHLRQARLNRELVGHLTTAPSIRAGLEDTVVQWAIVAAFYAAVHAVEADFARLGIHHRTHAERELDMDREVGIPLVVMADYRQLKAWSIWARYDCRRFTREYAAVNVLPRLDAVLRHFGV